jgi:hypothetical protein
MCTNFQRQISNHLDYRSLDCKESMVEAAHSVHSDCTFCVPVQHSAVIGSAERLRRPVRGGPTVPFISEEHCRRENLGVHSPGPVFGCRGSPCGHPSTAPSLHGQGAIDRFYSPFETGRLS